MSTSLQKRLRMFKKKGKTEDWLRGYARGWFEVELRYQTGKQAGNMDVREKKNQLVEAAMRKL